MRTVGRLSLGVALALACASDAFAAAEGAASHASESTFLLQIVVLLVVGRLLGEAMQRIGQPSIMGQLLGGLVLGPSVFGLIAPEFQRAVFPAVPEQRAMLDAVSQLGILLLLLMTGMETDLALVRRVGRAALSVSVTGVAVPFALGFTLGEFLPDDVLPHADRRLITALFLGTALSISSVKIVGLVVREMGFLRRNIGQIIVASAIIDDTIGWVIIAITFSLAEHGRVDLLSVGKSIVGVALFLGISFTVGRRAVFLLIRWANDILWSEAAVITTVLVAMGLMALTTHAIGVHTVLGAFVAGILVGQSPILTRQIDEGMRGLITGLFAPIFFGLAGLNADLTILRDPTLALLTAGLVAVASLGKFGGAFLGGRFGGLRFPESLALASGMNARGSTEVIVATIGLSIGALNESLFTMIVAMAVLTTLAMPPMLRWTLSRLPFDEAEQARLNREASEEHGFVPTLERLLLAANGTAKGRFAARLAGLLAGSRGMPVTVIRFGTDAANGTLAELVRHTAEHVQDAAATRNEDVGQAVDVIERADETPIDRAVLAEARKGYDLLVIGVEPTTGPDGDFTTEVTRLAESFGGPLAIVTARGGHLADPDDGALDILVPVNGTEVSRRGFEVALTVAQATGARLTVLHISEADPVHRPAFFRGVAKDDAILREAVALAEHYATPIKTIPRSGIDAAPAILRQARLGRHTLIVMGVARRPGEKLALGRTAEAVLGAVDRSVVFLAS